MSGIGLAATAIASLLLGHELARRVWKESLPWGERGLYATLIGTSVWLGSTWVLALLHVLTRPVLIARTALLVAVAIALLVMRLRRAERREVNLAIGAVLGVVIVVLPLFVFIDFSLWRGLVTPPASIDALSHHLPKAVMFARAQGFDALRDVRFMIGWRPANYELLLADAVVMDGGDWATEWISTYFYAAFMLAAVALAQRWHGSGLLPSLTAALLAAGVPVALLHATDYKNDVMTAYFSVAALVAMGRWLSQHDTRALVLAILALAGAAGTKTPTALFAALAIPLLAWPLVRRQVSLTRKQLARVAAASLAAFLFLGGVAYISRIGDRFATVVASTNTTSYSTSSYGHYANLWKGPYLLVTQSFSPDPTSVRVPWSPAPWMSQRYELYYSELGIPFSLCAMAFPFCVAWRLRKREVSLEQIATTLLALVCFAAILPFDGRPIGRALLGLPRFALTLVPVIFAWTAVPLVAWLARRDASGRLPAVPLIAAMVFFTWYAVKNSVHDTFVPIDYVMWASEHRGTRLPPIGHRRAAAVFDEAAGPRDRVAFDGGVSAQIHFTYGRDLQRPVALIPPGRGAPVIADDVQWVVIDRVWSLVWGHEGMKDLSATNFIRRGQPTEEDLRVMKAMLADPRFHAEYFDPGSMQAVFRRQ